MKAKKILSMMLVGAMAAALLAGCGSSASSEEEVQTASAGAESSDEASETTDEVYRFDELQTIDMYGLSFMGDDGLEEVMEEINSIAEEEINVNVNYHPLDIATYMQQIGLMLSGGESFDLTLVTSIPVVSFGTMTAQNELTDITEYLDEYAPQLKEKMADYLSATTVDGETYAVPCLRQYNTSLYVLMREDILDTLGLTDQARAISSWSEYEDIMLQVQEAQNNGELSEDQNVSCMICNADAQGTVITSGYCDVGAENFADDYGYDGLGDNNKIIYVDESGVVQNYFASDDYRASIERVNKWYGENLVYKDAATCADAADSLMLSGVPFSYICQAEYGAEVVKEMQTGYDLVAVKILDVPIQTTNVNAWGWAVPVTSKQPEAAVAFLNLLYTNADVENLFVYGIEGRDYTLTDEGEAELTADVVYQSSDFLYGDQFLAYPSAGNGGNFREESKADMENAIISEYYGFTINTDEIANELTALSEVLKKYEPGLESGVSDPFQIDTMNEELESSGLQTVLDYYQTNLDAWVAAN